MFKKGSNQSVPHSSDLIPAPERVLHALCLGQVDEEHGDVLRSFLHGTMNALHS